jgi:hypothetical protein
VNWCFKAFSDADRRDKKKLTRLQKIEETMEQHMINGKMESLQDHIK